MNVNVRNFRFYDGPNSNLILLFITAKFNDLHQSLIVYLTKPDIACCTKILLLVVNYCTNNTTNRHTESIFIHFHYQHMQQRNDSSFGWFKSMPGSKVLYKVSVDVRSEGFMHNKLLCNICAAIICTSMETSFALVG